MNQRHLLLLDPSDDKRRNLAFLLHLAGYRVTAVSDGYEALNRIAICLDAETIDLLVVCPQGPMIDVPELLGTLQQTQLPALWVSENAAPTWQLRNSARVSRICRRNEIIETLATLWPSDAATLSRPPIESVGPQEH